MNSFTATRWAVFAVSLVVIGHATVACGGGSESDALDPGGSAAIAGGDAGASTSAPNHEIQAGDGGTSSNAACDPPDMLIVLDRTLTMHQTPEGETPPLSALDSSKFALAIHAINGLVSSPLDQQIRFGLELWPRAPVDPKGQRECVTLAERVAQTRTPTNAMCEVGEIPVEPGIGTGGAIRSQLNPDSTLLCFSTPTGAALNGGADELKKIRVAGRKQYMVLVTDGADWDLTCPKPDPIAAVAAAAANDVSTFVVGFDAHPTGSGLSGVGKAFLNDMACAGRTAKNFANACHKDATGTYRANDPNGAPLFLAATNGASLAASLQTTAATVCCNCVR